MLNSVEADLSAKDGVKLYHEKLAKKSILPNRSLETDLEITDQVLLAEAK